MPSLRWVIRRRQSGQAAVELVALLPAIVLLGLIVWQLAAAAHAAMLADSAARAGARAAEVGAPVNRAVAAALPGGHERGFHAREATSDGRRSVRVDVRVPGLLPGRVRLGRVGGAADVAR